MYSFSFAKTLNLIHILYIMIILIVPNYMIFYLFNQNKFINLDQYL